MRAKNISSYIVTALIFLFYGLFLLHPISMTTADIGRHLQNGAVLFHTGSVIKTNFYSYTYPSFPVTNHHWGSGALLFLVESAAGFAGLHIFFMALSFAALLVFFSLARKETGSGIAGIIAIPAIFLLAERTEVRPEVLSYLFCGLFIWILVRVRSRPAAWRWLAALPILEILWVNSHIFFFLGPCIIGAFLIDQIIRDHRNRHTVEQLAAAFFASIAATLVNPFGFAGAAAPFTIFHNYGYRLAENQPVWFMERLTQDPNFLIFKIVFAGLAASFILRLAKKRGVDPVRSQMSLASASPHTNWTSNGVDWAYFFLALGISTMAWLQIRNLALFGLFSFPIISANIRASFAPEILGRHEKKMLGATFLILLLLIIPALFGHIQRNFPYWHEFGVGLAQNDSAAADFFKNHGLQGPIFNNYDIGGYLIFHLYPQERVFVDNRPEAYPASFFQDTYIPMQENNDAWRAEQHTYGFNAIFFAWHDATPWGQQFLRNRVNDPDWAPVFADQNAIIFLKRTETNKPVIDTYEIPKSAFGVRAPS